MPTDVETVRVIIPPPLVVRVEVGTVTNSATVWGTITGTLSDQTDLQAALDAAGSFLSENIARVDPSGNDGTGVVGDLSKPFLTVQGGIDAIEAGSFTNPVVYVGATGALEDVTTSLPKIALVGLVGQDVDSIQSLTCTDLFPSIYLDNFIVNSSGGSGICIDGAGSIHVYLAGFSEILGDIQAASAITITGNSETVIDGDIISTGNLAITIEDCNKYNNSTTLRIDSGTSNVTARNTLIYRVLGANELHLNNSLVASTNLATTTFIDGPKWVGVQQDLAWVGNDGVPTTIGTKYAGTGSLCSDYTNGNLYQNKGTKAAPNWQLVSVPSGPPSGSQIISGGGVAWTGTGFNYIISACVYLINGVQYNSAQTSVTLAAAHATLDRIDVFYVDTSGLAGVITGTPAVTPVAPSVDPASQLYLTFAYIVANTTTPVITNVNIYLENTEYTMSTNSAGTINLASTNNPYAGTKCIEGTSTATGNLFTAVKPSGTLDISAYANLVFQIRSKATWPNPKSISIFWMNGAAVVGTSVALHQGVFGFDSAQTSSYQQIVIPVSSFNTGTTVIDRLRMTVAGGGGNIGWYIDNIILQTGSGGGVGGTGDFSTNVNVSVAGEIVTFANTTGKLGTRATGTGIAKVTAGVLGTATSGTDYTALAFKTIAVSGQSDVVADTAADTLTLAAGSNITITTDATTDTITLASSASGSVSDTAYGSSWNGVTTIAPSKNAIYDELHLIDTADDGTIVNAGTGFRISGSAASGKILVGNGTNFVASTPTFPNASATSGKVIKSDGTNWVASTETYAAPGTSGNVATSDGTNWTSAAPAVSLTNTVTLTNKRVTKRVTSTSAPGATPTINTDNCDAVHLTALGTAITSMTTNLTGTPVEGDLLRIDFTDDGTARGITWGAKFEASTVALPTTTVISTRLDVGFIWNTVTTKWRCVAVA